MSERTGKKSFLLHWVLQPIWRLQRPLTLGAQGIVVDGEGRVLLVRHTYRPGWCFPGGGVEKGETILTALRRELHEECGVVIEGDPELYGIYSNEAHFRGDHIALFVVRHWHRTHVPAPNNEIAAQDFYPTAALPADCQPATERRVKEIFAGMPRDEHW